MVDVRAQLATVPQKRFLEPLRFRDVAAIEQAIDRYEAKLDPLEVFILPGGSRAAAILHLARAVCRRAERRLVSLMRAEPPAVPPPLLAYVNRLSDLLFVLARAANAQAGSGRHAVLSYCSRLTIVPASRFGHLAARFGRRRTRKRTQPNKRRRISATAAAPQGHSGKALSQTSRHAKAGGAAAGFGTSGPSRPSTGGLPEARSAARTAAASPSGGSALGEPYSRR